MLEAVANVTKNNSFTPDSSTCVAAALSGNLALRNAGATNAKTEKQPRKVLLLCAAPKYRSTSSYKLLGAAGYEVDNYDLKD